MWTHDFWPEDFWTGSYWEPFGGAPPVVPSRYYFRGRSRTTGAVQVGEKVYYIDE